jgi:Ca2+-binding EF-hand superfamily protein
MSEKCDYLRAKVDCITATIELQKAIYKSFNNYREGLITKEELDSVVSMQTKTTEQLLGRIIQTNLF